MSDVESASRSSARDIEASRSSERATRARRIFAPIRLAGLRFVRRPARTLVVAGGIALAVATLVAVSSGTLILRDRVLHQALEATPARQRSFRVDDFGLASLSSPADRRVAARALALLSGHRPVRTVAFRALRFQDHLVRLTALQDASRWLRLQSGRMPVRCSPHRCEVLAVGSTRLPTQLSTPGLRVVVVGRASIRVPSILGDFALPSDAVLLIGSDVRRLSTLPALQSDFRTESWVVPLAPGDIHSWDIDRLLSREARAQALLEQADLALALTAPDDALLNGRMQGGIGARRMLLIGGEVTGLLLGFALLAAIGLRRTIGAEWRRLEERGARRSQLWLFLVAETGIAAAVGALVGAALGIAVATWIGARAGTGADALVVHGAFTSGTLEVVAIAWLAATVLVALSVRPPLTARIGPVRIIDVVAVGALAVALVAASRGAIHSNALAANGSVTLLLLFPGLVSLAFALIAVRLLAPLLRLLERSARSLRPSIRLALLALARAPTRTSVAVAFFIASLGLALLAGSYRATLGRGVRDEAAYQVPLDYTITQGDNLVSPLDAAPLDRYRTLVPGVEAYPVLRRYGDVPSVGTQFASPVVIGLDPHAIARMHGWRSDFGAVPPDRLARLLAKQGTVRLAGAPLPRGTTGVGLAALRQGAAISLDVVIALPSGQIVRVPLQRPSTSAAGPPVPKRGRVVALELTLTQSANAEIAHREAEGAPNAGVEGILALGPLVAFSGGRRLGIVTDWHGWIGRDGARRLAGQPVRLRYALATAQAALLRPREPTDGHPLPLVVSPDIARVAAPGGLITFEFGTEQITGRIVAVSRRFPGTADGGGNFAIADESHLQTALDADAPGTGRPLELWLSARSRAARTRLDSTLQQRPFSQLQIVSRRGLEQRVRSDALSRSVALALGAGALIALALAIAGLWLTVLGDVSDERGELYDLEAQGATPGELRSQLRLRGAILLVLGLLGGLGLGLVLATNVVRLVQVNATGAAPVPPLVRTVDWRTAGLALLAIAVLAGGLMEVTLRRAFRQPTASATEGIT